MSKLTRTPPHKCSSESNIVGLDASDDSETRFVNTNRMKRPRTISSPREEDLRGFRGEINELLRLLKNEQGDNITKTIFEQTALMKNLANDFARLKTQNDEIKRTNDDIKTSITFINEKYDDMKNQVESLRREKQEQLKYIENLEKKINDLQFKSRTSCIEIRNVPYGAKETTSDLMKLVSNVGNISNISLNQSDIRDVYRTGGKQAKQRPIVVEFATVQMKTTFLSDIREFNKAKKSNAEKINTELLGIGGKRQPVYIAEHLPISIKKLHYSARAFAKEYNYNFCWVVNGNIYLRKTEEDKQILITTETTLNDLKASVK